MIGGLVKSIQMGLFSPWLAEVTDKSGSDDGLTGRIMLVDCTCWCLILADNDFLRAWTKHSAWRACVFFLYMHPWAVAAFMPVLADD